jgi:hypothetical protein
MFKQSSLPSPLDAQYAGHRDAEKRRRLTLQWLLQRERDLGFVADAPSVAPEPHEIGDEQVSGTLARQAQAPAR